MRSFWNPVVWVKKWDLNRVATTQKTISFFYFFIGPLNTLDQLLIEGCEKRGLNTFNTSTSFSRKCRKVRRRVQGRCCPPSRDCLWSNCEESFGWQATHSFVPFPSGLLVTHSIIPFGVLFLVPLMQSFTSGGDAYKTVLDTNMCAAIHGPHDP